VIDAARAQLSPRHYARFVAGHPIAGAEKSGVEAARVDLYERHRVILTPTVDTDAAVLATVRRLWECVGADVCDMDAELHDEVLAATSHLPHLLAYALVDCLLDLDTPVDVFDFAAGGFRDFTRIASSSPTMWRDIAIENRTAPLEAAFTRAKAARDEFMRRKTK
jgi:prephenate dehydrogenase